MLPDYSFPSGHTMNAVIFYGGVALLLWSIAGRRVGLISVAVATVVALGVGISRIYLGYHYLTDVVGGHPRRACLAGRRQRRVPGSTDVAALAHGVAGPPSGRRGPRYGGGQVTRALVIGRRRKGRHIGRTVRLVQTLLRADGWKVSAQMVTRKPALQRAAERAVAKGFDLVVAVGGDGAVVRVASGLAESKVELGIVPMGTGNLLAGNLDLPHGVHDATP